LDVLEEMLAMLIRVSDEKTFLRKEVRPSVGVLRLEAILA
jgi:hypothetical protein